MGLGSWFKETKDHESQSILKTQQSTKDQSNHVFSEKSMIKDKGHVIYCQAFTSKQPPKSSGKGTLIHFFFHLPYIQFFFHGIYEQVFPFPHTCFHQPPQPPLFFSFSFQSPHLNYRSIDLLSFQNKGRDMSILRYRLRIMWVVKERFNVGSKRLTKGCTYVYTSKGHMAFWRWCKS